MSATKFKHECNQPNISTYIDTPRPPRIAKERHSRSLSLKRKSSPSNKEQSGKRLITEDMAASGSPELCQRVENKTKKVYSPELMEFKNDMMDCFKELLNPINDSIKEILQVQKNLREELVDTKDMKAENERLTQKVITVEMNNEKLMQRVIKLENRLLESSVIIHGLYERPWEMDDVRKETIYSAISDTLLGRTYEERIEVARTMTRRSSRRIGKYNPMSSRPISVEFLFKEDAIYLLNNRKYLGESVYVDREYCSETEEKRKILCPYLWAARRLPQFHRKCRLEDDTLIIKGLSYTTDTLHCLPVELRGINLNSKSTQDVLGFFGSLNPLSNFYPCKFTHKGHTYHSSEQLIQHMKAEFFEDTNISGQILNSKSVIECKQLSREIQNYDQHTWLLAAKTICEQGIAEKFRQNSVLAKDLLSTGDKTLVECGYDDHWGTGVPLSDENCLDRERWCNQGILGEILMEIQFVDPICWITTVNQLMSAKIS